RQSGARLRGSVQARTQVRLHDSSGFHYSRGGRNRGSPTFRRLSRDGAHHRPRVSDGSHNPGGIMSNAHVIEGKATPRGRFPHIKTLGNLGFVSGTRSRNPDNTFRGVEVDEMGVTNLDIREQTRAVIENIRDILLSADLELKDLAQVTCYLVNMNDFGGFNEVWAEYFDETGPTRTTVAVHQLPHPHLLIEIQGFAVRP